MSNNDEAPAKKRGGGVHKRGGTHRVRDEDLTHTEYDSWNRAQLEAEFKTRVGYRKDWKKKDIAKALVADDARIAGEQRAKEQETQRKAISARKKKEDEQRARDARKEKDVHDRWIAKHAERTRLELERHEAALAALGSDSDSDSNPDSEAGSQVDSEAAPKTVRRLDSLSNSEEAEELGDVGQLLSDSESSDPESDTSTTTATSDDLRAALRLYEWSEPNEEEGGPWILRKVIYAPLQLVTTKSKETLQLPGNLYRDDVGADFVPKLSQHVIDCARNGVMVGNLRTAVVESGASWADRTDVISETGRIALKLPPRATSRSLAEVFAEDKKNKTARKMMKRASGNRVRENTIERRRQHDKDKRQLQLEVYAASEFRPPFWYEPVFLEHPSVYEEKRDGRVRMQNLFFVRFRDLQLPHYYFWVRPDDEWKDPTLPNPGWRSAKTEDQQQVLAAKGVTGKGHKRKHDQISVDSSPKSELERPVALAHNQIRVKKDTMSTRFGQKGQKRVPERNRYLAAVANIERQLYEDGLAAVMFKYSQRWKENGKGQAWQVLIDDLPRMCPSGTMPTKPPVHVDAHPRSLAEKLACAEISDPSRELSPIRGDEPWTRDDDELWDIVDIADASGSNMQSQSSCSTSEQELTRPISPLDGPIRHQTRKSAARHDAIGSWVDAVNSSKNPQAPQGAAKTISSRKFRTLERQAWELRFEAYCCAAFPRSKSLCSLSTAEVSSSPITTPVVPNLGSTIESMPIAELKWQLYFLMSRQLLVEERCKVCSEPLVPDDLVAMRRHYLLHQEKANEHCPFCGMKWDGLESKSKAQHIFDHDYEDPKTPRQASCVVRFSIPADVNFGKGRKLRRTSKVHFSPQTVERRIAYNDIVDTTLDGDASSTSTPSPKKSSLRKRNRGVTGGTSLRIITKDDDRLLKRRRRHGGQDTLGQIPDSTDDLQRRRSSLYDLRDLDQPVKKTRKISDPTYHDSPPSPATTTSLSPDLHLFGEESRPIKSILTKPKRKMSDPTYEDVPPSPATTSSLSPVLYLIGEPSDPTYRDMPNSASSASIPDHSVQTRSRVKNKRLANKKSRGETKRMSNWSLKELAGDGLATEQSRQTSTASNASSGSNDRRARALEIPALDIIEPVRSSPGRPRKGESKVGPKSLKTKVEVKGSKRNAENDVEKLDTEKERRKTKKDEKKASEAAEEFGDRDFIGFVDVPLLEASEDELTGNPFAPPPGKSKPGFKTKAKANGKGRTSRRTAQCGKANPPLTAAQSPPSPGRILTSTTIRGRRSSAPTPSPSLQPTNASPMISPLTKAPIVPEHTRKRASYDIPYSETGPIVPSNTPVPRLRAKRKLSRQRSTTSFYSVHSEDDVHRSLDIVALADKISGVKTTRAGMARDLSKGMGRSISGKSEAAKKRGEKRKAKARKAKRS